ncbi:MAG: hypothetical protein KY468_12055 [Armatimonadetes bacterium]|nr:hypothetical protein [Armatimonadota bacterium]
MTLYLGIKYPSAFSKLALLSPSAWWVDERIVREVAALPKKLPLRIWLDRKTNEGPKPTDLLLDSRRLRDALLQKGWTPDANPPLKNALQVWEEALVGKTVMPNAMGWRSIAKALVKFPMVKIKRPGTLAVECPDVFLCAVHDGSWRSFPFDHLHPLRRVVSGRKIPPVAAREEFQVRIGKNVVPLFHSYTTILSSHPVQEVSP